MKSEEFLKPSPDLKNSRSNNSIVNLSDNNDGDSNDSLPAFSHFIKPTSEPTAPFSIQPHPVTLSNTKQTSSSQNNTIQPQQRPPIVPRIELNLNSNSQQPNNSVISQPQQRILPLRQQQQPARRDSQQDHQSNQSINLEYPEALDEISMNHIAESQIQSNRPLSESVSDQIPQSSTRQFVQNSFQWIIILTFLILIILILFSFIKVLIDSSHNTSKPHYEVINYNSTSTHLQVLAVCRLCKETYLSAQNPTQKSLIISVQYLSQSDLSIEISPQNSTEWNIPQSKPFPGSQYTPKDEKHLSNRTYTIQIKEKPLEIHVTRTSTQEPIFILKSTDSGIIYSDKFKLARIDLPSPHIFGLAQNLGDFLMKNQSQVTLWSRRSQLATPLPSSSPPHSLNLDFQELTPRLKDSHTHPSIPKKRQSIPLTQTSKNDTTTPATSNRKKNSETHTNGFHPVLLQREKSAAYSLIYFHSSSAIEATLLDSTLNFITITGNLNFKLFLGDGSPTNVVQDFHRFIGGYITPPLWSLGIHYKMKDVKSNQQIRDTQQVFQQNHLRIDGLWFDASLYKDNESFRFNKESLNITEFKNLTSKIQVIPEIQPSIIIDQDSIAYTEGIQRDIFLKSNKRPPSSTNDPNTIPTSTTIFGKNSYLQSTHYPDYFHPSIQDYTNDVYTTLFKEIHFTGVLLVDNEVTDYTIATSTSPAFTPLKLKKSLNHINSPSHSNSHNIENQNQFQQPSTPTNSTLQSSTDLPYLPGNLTLDKHSISISSMHYGGIEELRVHNLFALTQVFHGFQFLTNQQQVAFPFMISKSSSTGFGRFGGKLIELPECDWPSLRSSLVSMLNYNIFGVPIIGFSFCPLIEEVAIIDEELFARWMQLSTFYTFFVMESLAKRPSEYLVNPKFATYFKTNTSLRGLLSKYIFSLYFRFQGKGAIIKPLFFDFPNDPLLMINPQYIDRQFLVGDALMISPVIDPNQSTVQTYFPQSTWLNFFTGEMVKKKTSPGSVSEVYCSINGPAPVFMRGGHIIPLQSMFNPELQLTEQTMDYDLLIGFDDSTDNVSNKSNSQNNSDGDNSQIIASATGFILGKTILSDPSLLDSCLKENCLFRVEAKVIRQSNNKPAIKTNSKSITAPQTLPPPSPTTPLPPSTSNSDLKIEILFDTVIPFVQVDTVHIKSLVLLFQGKRYTQLVNYNISRKQSFQFNLAI